MICVVYRVGERSSGVSSRSRCDRDSCLSPWLGAACFAFCVVFLIIVYYCVLLVFVLIWYNTCYEIRHIV